MAKPQDIIADLVASGKLSPRDAADILKSLSDVTAGYHKLADGFKRAREEATTLGERVNVLKDSVQNALGVTEEQADTFGVGAVAMAGYAIQTSELIMSLGGLNKQLFDVEKRQRESAEGFNKLTGFSGQYNTMIMDSVFANRDLGLSAEENSAIFANLTSTFTDFSINGLSPTELGLAEAAMALQAVGIDAETSTKSFQILRKGFGQTDTEIVRTTLGLENFAEELGVTSSEIFSTFNEQMPVLAMFGNEAERVFRESAAAAKATGIEFSKQMEMFDLTDTFEGSAQAVGSLNALLGGPFLNAVELTMAETPVERMQMLSDAFNDAGISVDDLSRRQIQAFVAATPGIENATELIKLQKGGFDELLDATDATAKSRAELSQEASRQRSIEENERIVFEVLKGVDGIAQGFDQINAVGFTAAINSAENFRDVVGEKLAPAVGVLKNQIRQMTEDLGVTVEQLNTAREVSTAERNERLGQVTTGTGGQQTIRVQLMLDGEEILDKLLENMN